MLHNNACIVEYNSKLCLKTAEMYTKVHVHRVYIVFTLPCSTLRHFSLKISFQVRRCGICQHGSVTVMKREFQLTSKLISF